MTVIVWDGHILAADRLADNNGIKSPITKIGQIEVNNKKYLYGFSGVNLMCLELLEWFKAGADPEKFTQALRENKGDAVLLLISEFNEIFIFEGGPYPTNFSDARRFAIGSGRDIAYGAMAMGADAYQAVKVACEIQIGCGIGINTLKF
jgi:hypothetical protein